MKKQIFGLMALILCACSGLTACSDDDDDDNNGAHSTLVGTWECTGNVEWTSHSSKPYDPEAWELLEKQRLELTSDGKITWYEWENGKWEWSERGTYTFGDNKIIQKIYNYNGYTDDSGEYDQTIWSVDELSNNTLIITSTDYEDGGKWIDRYRFKKIN